MGMIMMSQRMMASHHLQEARADVLVRNNELVFIQMLSEIKHKGRKNTQSTHCKEKELLLNRMFYNVFCKDSAAPQSTTSLNMGSRHGITVHTKLVFRLHSLSFQRLPP